MKKEEKLLEAVCRYLRLKYPYVIYINEASGLRLPIGLAKKMKSMRYSDGLPDLVILIPSKRFHGLALELKNSKGEYLRKDGKLRGSEHLIRQATILNLLRRCGYAATFASKEDVYQIIDDYIRLGKADEGVIPIAKGLRRA